MLADEKSRLLERHLVARTPDCHQWKSWLRNPLIHQGSDRLAAGSFECAPEVVAHGVMVGVFGKIRFESRAKCLVTDQSLDHAQQSSALGVDDRPVE